MKTSLSKDSGEEFLEKIETFNPNLKQHINRYRDFINLIYEFSEKVIHQEGPSSVFPTSCPIGRIALSTRSSQVVLSFPFDRRKDFPRQFGHSSNALRCKSPLEISCL